MSSYLAASDGVSIGTAFSGAKIALLCGGDLITYRRDRKEGIPFPGLWDLPGGGREGEETPIACALREVEEEFGIRIDADRVVWSRAYPGRTAVDPATIFLVATIDPDHLTGVVFGDEGERWEVMAACDFLSHPEAVPHRQRRLAEYLDHAAAQGWTGLSSP